MKSSPSRRSAPMRCIWLGVLASQRGKFDVAIAMITQAIAIGPATGEYHYNLGGRLPNAGKFHESLEHARRRCVEAELVQLAECGAGSDAERSGNARGSKEAPTAAGD